MANDPALAQLADMLKRTQHRRVIENAPPATPPATAQASLPNFQIPGMNTSPVGTPPFLPPQSPAAAPMAAPPAMPPAQANAPPVIAPGDQTVPPLPPPTQIGGPSTPGWWERFNKSIASGQVPEGYRGAMGEMIKNV